MPVPAPGVRFGPYEAIAPLGAGGMGEVWKARDTRVDRLVAIKVPQQRFSERFEREIRASAALNHPNICSLYDIGPDFLVMEYVEGAPVGPTPNVRKLLELAVQVADGLAAAHDRGIIHRDLKPENILVTPEGRVKILDFGLAKQETALAESDETQTVAATHPGTVMGTVAYMSPEQARGLPLDARSDQFSFGAILYEIASGKRPFSRESAPQTMTAIIEAEPEPLPPGVPAPLRWIVERCLAKEPSARYESTRDLYRDLRSLRDHLSEVLSGSGGTAAVEPRGTSARHWLRAGAALLGALLVGGAGYWMGTRGGPGSRSLMPPTTPLTSSGGVVDNPSFSPDGAEVVFAWDGPRGGSHNLYIKLIGANDLLRLTNNASDEASPAWSPDGKQIAFVRRLGRGRSAVMLISRLGGSERRLTEISLVDWGAEGHSLLAFSPDGRYLAAADGRRLDLISIDTGDRQLLNQESQGIIGDADPSFSPEGNRLAFVRRLAPFSSRPVWIPLDKAYRRAGEQKPLTVPGIVTFSPQWTGDKEMVLAAGAPYQMRLYRATLSATAAVPASETLAGGCLALNRNSGRLIFTSVLNIQNLYQLRLDGAGQVSGVPERLTATSGTDVAPRYSPDGANVAFTSTRSRHYGIWTIQVKGTLDSELAMWTDGMVLASDWAPDGRSVLFFGTVPAGWWQIYRSVVDTRKVTQLVSEASHDIYPTFSRDGSLIYFSSSREGGLKLFKMPSAGGALTVVVPQNVVEARESSDGHWLYFGDFPPNRLYRMPLSGGEITPLVEGMPDVSGYALSREGVYYWRGGGTTRELHYLDAATRKDVLVWRASTQVVPQLSLSPDGHSVTFPVIERNSQELMMLEGWR